MKMPTTIGSSARPDYVGDIALDDLQVERQEDDRAEHRDADEEAEDVADRNTRLRNSASGRWARLARCSSEDEATIASTTRCRASAERHEARATRTAWPAHDGVEQAETPATISGRRPR